MPPPIRRYYEDDGDQPVREEQMPADEWRRRRDVEELRGLFARGRAMLGSPPMDPQTLAEARADIIELDSRQRHIVEALLRLVRLRVLRGEDVGRE